MQPQFAVQPPETHCLERGRPESDLALVVLVRGINVGGHRRFRPALLARQLAHLDAVNIGAAGTLVIRRPVTRVRLRTELARRIPFEAEIVICEGREVLELLSRERLAQESGQSDLVRFVSVLSSHPRSTPAMPVRIPATGNWLVKILARQNRFLLGVYRRQMKVIGCLGRIDRLFGVPATTRSWNTVTAIAKVLDQSRKD